MAVLAKNGARLIAFLIEVDISCLLVDIEWTKYTLECRNPQSGTGHTIQDNLNFFRFKLAGFLTVRVLRPGPSSNDMIFGQTN